MTVISNANAKIWMALKSRLVQWSETSMHLPMQNYSPDAADRFVIAQHVTTEYGGPVPVSLQCGVGFSGFLNLSVMCPVDLGYDQLVGLAGRVCDHFPNGAKYSYSDMSVSINGRARVDGNVSLNAPWNRLELQVPWTAWG